MLRALARLDDDWARRLNAPLHTSPRLRQATSTAAQHAATAEVGLMLALGLRGRISAALRMLAAVTVIYALVEIVGRAVRRRRPFERLEAVRATVEHDEGRSFPSRHVASAVAMALIALAERSRLGWLMAALAGVLGVARIAAGLHYPSDVLAGAALGYLAGRALRRHS